MKTLDSNQAASAFAVNQKIVAYRTKRCFRVLTRLGDHHYGFVSIGSNDMPAFCGASPARVLELATVNKSRDIYIMDYISQLTKIPTPL